MNIAFIIKRFIDTSTMLLDRLVIKVQRMSANKRIVIGLSKNRRLGSPIKSILKTNKIVSRMRNASEGKEMTLPEKSYDNESGNTKTTKAMK